MASAEAWIQGGITLGVLKVAAVGLGYVGTVTAACLASRGHDLSGRLGKEVESQSGYEGIG
jgi:UDP-N-acetyl-D-mannosaminuronate dehydrogenase